MNTIRNQKEKLIAEYVKSLGLNVGNRFRFLNGVFAGERAVMINKIGYRFLSRNNTMVYGIKTFCISDIDRTKVEVI